MAKEKVRKRRDRKNFAKIPDIVSIPNLIEIQKKSFERFLQLDSLPSRRGFCGLEEVFKSVFPINDINKTNSLEYVGYEIGSWECECGDYAGLGSSAVVCGKCKKKLTHKLKYSIDECHQKGMTYADPIKVLVRLAQYDKEKIECPSHLDPSLVGKFACDDISDRKTGRLIFPAGHKFLKEDLGVLEKEYSGELTVRSIREIKEQKIYLGEIPLMTDNGTFVVNGVERVIVSQMHRSPGTFFSHDKGKSHPSGKFLYSARIIPYRGSWLDFEFDIKDILFVRIDRRRKFPATVLLQAIGYSNAELLAEFYDVSRISCADTGELYMKASEVLTGMRVKTDVLDPQNKDEVLLKAFKKATKASLKRIGKLKDIPTVAVDDGGWECGCGEFKFKKPEGQDVICGKCHKKAVRRPSDIVGKIFAYDVVDESTGLVIGEENTAVTESLLDKMKELKIQDFYILRIDESHPDTALRDTLAVSKVSTTEEAVGEIYKRMRPGDPPSLDVARSLLRALFFDMARYDLSEVGRLKMNERLCLDFPLDQRTLTKDDIIAVVRYLLNLRQGIGNIDDIDHLGNRRIRSVGESIENQFRVGMVRMERAIRERMSITDMAVAMPHDLINSKPISAAIKEFFGSSQLSQFMDQTNPLSEITHKRRLSALGPGGLTRERAGFEVRDVHPTHYGRICPVETPEGPNIGLIASLSAFARVNQFGFIETPYRRVESGRATDTVDFLTASQEEKFVIAQAKTEMDKGNRFTSEMISARHSGEYVMVEPEKIHYMEISPKQLISVAASLIPFLEHDDANRALMGSNMQRQAVPLMRTEAPRVGTGMEDIVARDSGAVVVARNSGEIVFVDAQRIVVRKSFTDKDTLNPESNVDIYSLKKFQKSNQNTCINQKSIVKIGEKVKRGDVIADGFCTDNGELALGRNVRVAFLPWEGYNFEDAIIVSEKLVREDVYTSIHIEEFEVEARDTKQGKEEITRDIPNIGEEALKDLDESGIIRLGAKIQPDDILVGKITPKGETQLSPEEKLLKAIFGEKAEDVRDTSLRVPPGVEGTVIKVQVFSRRGMEKDSRSQSIEEEEITALENDTLEEIKITLIERDNQLRSFLVDKVLAEPIEDPKSKKTIAAKGKHLAAELLKELSGKNLTSVVLRKSDTEAIKKFNEIIEASTDKVKQLKNSMNEKISRLKKGDELAPGVIKLVKVYVAMKRKLSVGDKMAGRHGNKGVVSVIVPEEDMPFMEDGTPIEIILNPLGVPSRMNVGQILETYLGMAAAAQNTFVASPVFDGATEEDIRKMLKESHINEFCQVTLNDGRFGKKFDQPVTVGVIYMMKLHHLVDDKIHARSTGPYSLVTQQPLGGKAQFGGQRLGEMEVWALEAYGSAFTLQEMLTVKSDDVEGRRRMYESIVKGESSIQPSLPESFNVLVKELQSLSLDVELLENKKQ
ncbi:MAG: DNA-directed RNA polymerase subunit beta [Nitrospinae bacterium]|nr:DNA-directed RNA polymerase subunit beta [Nitrospinota bacterium]